MPDGRPKFGRPVNGLHVLRVMHGLKKPRTCQGWGPKTRRETKALVQHLVFVFMAFWGYRKTFHAAQSPTSSVLNPQAHKTKSLWAVSLARVRGSVALELLRVWGSCCMDMGLEVSHMREKPQSLVQRTSTVEGDG